MCFERYPVGLVDTKETKRKATVSCIPTSQSQPRTSANRDLLLANETDYQKGVHEFDNHHWVCLEIRKPCVSGGCPVDTNTQCFMSSQVTCVKYTISTFHQLSVSSDLRVGMRSKGLNPTQHDSKVARALPQCGHRERQTCTFRCLGSGGRSLYGGRAGCTEPLRSAMLQQGSLSASHHTWRPKRQTKVG